MLKSTVIRSVRKLPFQHFFSRHSHSHRPIIPVTCRSSNYTNTRLRLSSFAHYPLSQVTNRNDFSSRRSHSSIADNKLLVDDFDSSTKAPIAVTSTVVDTDAYLAIELALDSVVKIFTVSSSPNYTLPWQNKSQRESMGSGGDNISVTKGVVSRVEPTQYVHGATQLLAIQIDAAINPGNSGGPAIMGDKVAGVAFQNLSGAENIGYIIPVPVIKHFIAGLDESGKYIGFCSLGLSCQPTENVQLREHFRMRPELTGVLVSKINPLSDAHRVLKKDDIVLAFDGVPIANDGTGLSRVLCCIEVLV